MKNFNAVTFTSVFLLLLSFNAIAQSKDESWKLYDDSQVAVIEITMDQSALDYMYANVNSDSLHFATVHFKNKYIDETIDSVGIRLRGNTSRDARKKSFKLEFNGFIKGRDFYDVENLNLNGEHNDPSIIRSKLIWDLYGKIGMNASRAAHAAVYINGNYYGLYISVEHIDEEFLQKRFTDDEGNLWKCLYPADLVYKGSNPDLYKSKSGGRRTYDLTTNEDTDDYFMLARLIDIINNTSSTEFQDSLEKIFSLEEFLKYVSVDVLTGCWDDYWYLKNNYYLYHEPSKDLIHWIPYDTDNSFGVDWFSIDWANVNPYTYSKIGGGDEKRPLIERILTFADYRNLYTHFLDFIVKKVYNTEILEKRIDSLKSILSPYAEQDTYKNLDYGFTNEDFNNSYLLSGYNKAHVKYGLKEFISKRVESIKKQLVWVNSNPVVYSLDWYPKSPGFDDTVYVNASIFAKNGIKDVTLNFKKVGTGEVFKTKMEFKPVPGSTKINENDLWIGRLSPIGIASKGYFAITVTDSLEQKAQFPRRRNINIQTAGVNSASLVINELLAKNDSLYADDNGEYDDWIEIFNPTSQTISLTGKFLTDDPDKLNKWQFTSPGLELLPGHFQLIWCDEDSSQGDMHTNFKLDGGGEFLALVDADGATILDSLTYPDQSKNISFGRYPDGSDNWQKLVPTPQGGNTVTSVDEDLTPVDFRIAAYPNPFNPSTKIEFVLPSKSHLTLSIHNILGEKLWTKSGEYKEGSHSFVWNGIDNMGNKLTSGIYLLNIKSADLVKTIKLMMIK
ncbi:MAG: T9SS C-terminal target domain-containing protein [Ignavibacteriales bacterium]|nr:MAG: T9SS C-terminal target domain-containing protein [Ignavibacteriales bacterium]